MVRKLIILELNEVPNKVIDRYVADHPDSAWATMLRRAARFTAATPDTGYLHPKTSWQTFHRGIPDHVHGIVEYNQDVSELSEKYPTVLEIFSRAGHSIGCGASIGSYPLPKDLKHVGFYLPDPFAPTFETKPDYLSSFQKFNNIAVARSGRVVRKNLPIPEALEFVVNIPRLGISARSLYKTAKQLVSERIDAKKIVRRRSIQALMSFDVCMRQIKREKPVIATIFSNHVASAMHRYWAASFEDDYKQNKMPLKWRRDYRGEIDYAMTEADYMLRELMSFCQKNPEYKVLCLGSMGQHGVEHEVCHNQLLIADFPKFMSQLEIPATNYRRLMGMEPEIIVEFTDPAALAQFENQCAEMYIGEQKPLVEKLNNTQVRFEVMQTNVAEDISVRFRTKTGRLQDYGLLIEPIQDLAESTAQHVKEGCCIVFDGQNDLSQYTSDEIVDLTAVTASILAAHDVEVPTYMPKPDKRLVSSFA